ncbi:MAG: 4Fe-4S dicluster domain-containing protein [Myxococcales bacterium]|nr:4Fe-4S dicluster domain-containing protein [Myxococcales bacterium]
MPELDRRDFLKLVGLGAGTAAAAGCSDPIEDLVPYVVQPETVTPGIPTFYASTCRECAAACGLHVRTREGRPIKLEGNPEHPINQGRLCARGQAGIGRTYHPDRYAGPMARSGDALAPTSWSEAEAKLAGAVKAAPGRTWVLGASRGPTIDGIVDAVVAGAGLGGRVVYSTFDGTALRGATEQVFGIAATPLFDLSSADLVLDFGSDFLGTGSSPVEHAAQLAEARDIAKHPDGGAKLVAIGPRLTLTASNAERWIPASAGSEGALALALAKAVASRRGVMDAALDAALAKAPSLSAVATAADVDAHALETLAADLASAGAAVAMPPGPAASGTNAVAANAAVLLLNAVVGAVGSRVRIPAQPDPAPNASYAEVQRLVDAMSAGHVAVLVVHDANPLYSLPASSGFAQALAKVGTVVSLAPLADETSQAAHLVLPDHTPLESWGDAAPRAGVRSLVQPTVRPLQDTKAIGDVFLALGRALGADVPAGDTRSILEAAWGGAASLRQALARGGRFGASDAGGATVQPSAAAAVSAPSTLSGRGEYTLVAYPHSTIGDGSGAALPWMQEIPDPVTKLSWRSWAEVSKATATSLGLKFGDIVEVTTDAGAIELPVYPRGGVRDDVVAIAVGQGHTVGHYASLAGDGQPGVARGASVIAVLPAATDEKGGRAWLATKASLRRTGAFQRIALSQWTDNQRGRGLAPTVSLAALAGHDDHHGGHHELLVPYDRGQDAHPDEPYRWGMTIDNDRCTGCSACIAACYVENNVAIVGEANALKHREMTWIRIERYVGDGDREGGEERRPVPDREELGRTDVRHAPMLCQHCGAAPCESVCPVIATYHSPDGLNGMIYNRCVGTRYCANNCVYKVRRFNYFDYGNDNWPGLLSLMLNPDVTVRQQGVMEKCTFCVQRIHLAKQPRKDAGQILQDGDVVTACQQSCPTGAITFGNTRDAKAAVNAKAKQADKRAYHSLHVLNTRPGITYLAQVTRDSEESHA